jgi:hypothetical protein
VTVDDTRRDVARSAIVAARKGYATLARKIERYGRAHLRLGSVFTPAADCGFCHLAGLAADAVSISLDCAVAEASRARRTA